MKPGKLFWGFLFLTLGILFLLKSLFGTNFVHPDLYKTWPLIFVLFGGAFLINDVRAKFALFGGAGLIAALCIFSSVTSISTHFHGNNSKSHKYSGTDKSSNFNANIKRVILNIEGGAGSFTVLKIDSLQYQVTAQDSIGAFSCRESISGEEMKLAISSESEDIHITSKDDLVHGLKIGLNPNPNYDIHFSTGASSNNLDLSELKVDKLRIDCGAASTFLKLGAPAKEESKIEIESGASSFKLMIPKDAAVRIVTSTAFSSTNINGIKHVDDDTYQTDDYFKAEKKYFISIDGGVMSVDIQTY